MSTSYPWKVLHLELSDGIPALPADSDVWGLCVVFWWHGIPLGHRRIFAYQLPMTAAELTAYALETITPTVNGYLLEKGSGGATSDVPGSTMEDVSLDFHTLVDLDQPLKELQERLSQCGNEASTASVSVIVCTRDRPVPLRRCLRSLLDLSQHPKEILVVDNAPSTDATRRLVAEMPEVHYVLEPQAGLDVARNAGIRHSTGDIIAFTDDDVTVHPEWILRLRQAFQDPEVMAVTGLTLPAELETEAQLLFETHWGFNRGYRPRIFDSRYFKRTQARGTPVWNIGAGANMAFRRATFKRVGLFDERLDVGAAGCSGDSELWYRVLAEGGTCRYEPAAVVHHYHRRSMEHVKRQLFFYMRGHVAALLIQYEKYGHWGNLYRLLLLLPKYYVELFGSGLLHGFGLRHRTLMDEAAGCLSGVKFYLLNRHSRMKHTSSHSTIHYSGGH